MPVISSLTPATTVLPLIFVLLVSGLKEIVDDYVSIFSKYLFRLMLNVHLERELTCSDVMCSDMDWSYVI